MFVKKDVYKIEATKDAYAYAIRNDYGITLIDTHYPGKGAEIMAELQSVGLEKVARILLTHLDIDHIGNVAYIHNLTGCDIYLSAREKDSIDTPSLRKGPGGNESLAAIASLPLRALAGDAIAGIGIIPAYGHTWGHTCFLYDGVLFVGDLLAEAGGKLEEMALHYIKDHEQSRQAIKQVSDNVKFDLLCPAHGEPLTCAQLTLS